MYVCMYVCMYVYQVMIAELDKLRHEVSQLRLVQVNISVPPPLPMLNFLSPLPDRTL